MTHLLPVIASRELGQKEIEGSNCGPDVRRYQRASNLDPGAWPWCAAFVCFVIREWLKNEEVKNWLQLKKATTTSWRPKTALAYGFLEWAKRRPSTVKILTDRDKPLPGDLVTYDFSHIGVIEHSCSPWHFSAIEGNTNAQGIRDGDGVWSKVRRRKLAKNFFRIHPSTL